MPKCIQLIIMIPSNNELKHSGLPITIKEKKKNLKSIIFTKKEEAFLSMKEENIVSTGT